MNKLTKAMIVALVMTTIPMTAYADGGTSGITSTGSTTTSTDTTATSTGSTGSTTTSTGSTTTDSSTSDGATSSDGNGTGGHANKGHSDEGLQNALAHVKNPRAQAVLQALLNGESPAAAAQSLDSLDGGTGTNQDGSTTGATTTASDTSSSGTTSTSGASTSSSSDSATIDSTATAILTALENDQQDSNGARAGALKKVAEELANHGDLTDGIQAGEDAVAATPTDTSAYTSLGQMLAKQDKNSVAAFVNGTIPVSDVKPFIKDGRTLIPVRAIAQALGAVVSWDAATQTVTLTKDGHTITLTSGSDQATIDGKTVTLDVPAGIFQSRTFVPARFVSQAFGAVVQWFSTGDIVDITTSGSGTTTSTSSTTGTGTDTATTSTSTSTTGTTPTTSSTTTTTTTP